jgi:hypothetical protein
MDKIKALETTEQPPNGKPPAPSELPIKPTPQQRLAAFQQGLVQLQEKFGVVIVPFIKTYNNGQQVADIEMIAKQE